jgi:cytoskeletal protein CcmA (bactofilin family)
MLVNKTPVFHHGTQWPAQPSALDRVLSTPRVSSGVSAQSVIDPSVTLVGDVWSEGDVQVDGRICGSVNCVRLVVGRTAAVTGTILADEVVVGGRTTGTIRAIRVFLQSTARVESEIVYKLLSIDAGARFEGAASYRSNPLQDRPAVSPLSELREIVAEAEAARFAARERLTRITPRLVGDSPRPTDPCLRQEYPSCQARVEQRRDAEEPGEKPPASRRLNRDRLRHSPSKSG